MESPTRKLVLSICFLLRLRMLACREDEHFDDSNHDHKPKIPKGLGLVPGGGIEPPRAEARRILSPLRLPVPPSRLRVPRLKRTLA